MMYSNIQKDNSSFKDSLKYMALQCTNGTDIHTAWHDFLQILLNEWNADIQMNLDDAIAFILSAAGLNEYIIRSRFVGIGFFNYCILSSVKQNKIKFWFKLPADLQMFPQEIQHKKRIFLMTVAIFETINYWCWHDSPFLIFNKEQLINVLENGSVNIDWKFYQQSL